jgi:hypothetical protein
MRAHHNTESKLARTDDDSAQSGSGVNATPTSRERKRIGNRQLLRAVNNVENSVAEGREMSKASFDALQKQVIFLATGLQTLAKVVDRLDRKPDRGDSSSVGNDSSIDEISESLRQLAESPVVASCSTAEQLLDIKPPELLPINSRKQFKEFNLKLSEDSDYFDRVKTYLLKGWVASDGHATNTKKVLKSIFTLAGSQKFTAERSSQKRKAFRKKDTGERVRSLIKGTT